jgi:hypothetical protein
LIANSFSNFPNSMTTLTSCITRCAAGAFAAVVSLLLVATANGQLFPTFIDGEFTLGNTGVGSPYDYADTFLLESNPTASKTIYLDFTGYHSVDNRWAHSSNGGIVFDAFDRDGDPSNFTNNERLEIQRQFQNVAEDFLPFDVNVTTRDPGVARLRKDSDDDQFYGIRAVNTQAKNGFGNGIGGVAYLNSFDDTNDNPVFTFNKGANNGAMTNSHEVGHALGLQHDGLGSRTYHPGTGSGQTGWGPIMGAPFGKNLTQWSNGDYANSTSTQDDLAVITKNQNGFGFRDDQVGDDIESASLLSVVDGTIFDWGIIERNTDFDFFEMNLGTGQLVLDIDPFADRPNLDILASLYDGEGNLLETSNPFEDVDANFDLFLDAGDYYLSITGTGKDGVYSDYGSLGFYSIQGLAPLASVPEPGTAAFLSWFALIALRRQKQ